MIDPVWDALFVVPYQSSDETDVDEGIDPETDSDEVTVNVPSRAWVTRPPTYRAAVVSLQSVNLPSPNFTYHTLQVTEAIAQLDLLVKTCQKELNQSRDMKIHVGQPHARRLGEQQEKPLPYPGKGDPIHVDLIDPTWLANHPESASCRMILHWTKPVEEEGELADVEDWSDDEIVISSSGYVNIDPVLRSGFECEGNEDSEGLYADYR